MSKMNTFEISVKGDSDGFILLQCSLCGEFFKLCASDLNDDSILNVWCPYCGLNGKKYYTEEVIEMGMRIAKSEINQMIYNSFKNLERKTKNNKFITFKCGPKPLTEVIMPIKSRLEKLETIKYDCCKSKAKIRPIAIITGSYCPLCGGANFE